MYQSPLESPTASTGTRPFPSSLLIKTSPPHDHHRACNTGLSLGLPGSEDAVDNKLNVRKQTLMSFKFGHLLPPLSLGLPTSSSNHKNTPHSGGVLPGRQHVSEEDEVSPRKKLRLTKYQYIVLEDIFKNHANLTPNQKQALAKRLNLQPRQVEVWFQNRRARIKLKQTEAECELLKKCCRRLTEENERLHKELLDLKLARGVGATTTATAPTHSPAVHIAMPPAAIDPLHLPFLHINDVHHST